MCHSPTPGTFCSLFGCFSHYLNTDSQHHFLFNLFSESSSCGHHFRPALVWPLSYCPIKMLFYPPNPLSSCHCLLIQHWVHFYCHLLSSLSVYRPHVLTVLLFSIMTYCTCLVPLPRTISYFDRPHFTLVLTGFPSKIGVKIRQFPSVGVMVFSKFQWMFSTRITPFPSSHWPKGWQMSVVLYLVPRHCRAKIRPPLPSPTSKSSSLTSVSHGHDTCHSHHGHDCISYLFWIILIPIISFLRAVLLTLWSV